MFKAKYLLAVIFLLPVFVFAYPTSFPKPTGFVTDTAGALSASTRQVLEDDLRNFAQSKGYEVAVLIVPTLEGTTVEDYAVRVFEKWKIGDKKLDTGVLFLVAINDHQMRIEVGYGAEPVLTDVQSSQILETIVKPFFKQGFYDEGIKAGVRAIENILSGEPMPSISNHSFNIDLHVLFFIFVVLQILVSGMARTKSWWFGGVAGGVISLILILLYASALAILFKIIIILISSLFGLIIDYFVSKHWKDAPRGGGPNIWFLGGGGRSSGGGFGGFGGGSSGGGGSSSSW